MTQQAAQGPAYRIEDRPLDTATLAIRSTESRAPRLSESSSVSTQDFTTQQIKNSQGDIAIAEQFLESIALGRKREGLTLWRERRAAVINGLQNSPRPEDLSVEGSYQALKNLRRVEAVLAAWERPLEATISSRETNLRELEESLAQLEQIAAATRSLHAWLNERGAGTDKLQRYPNSGASRASGMENVRAALLDAYGYDSVLQDWKVAFIPESVQRCLKLAIFNDSRYISDGISALCSAIADMQLQLALEDGKIIAAPDRQLDIVERARRVLEASGWRDAVVRDVKNVHMFPPLLAELAEKCRRCPDAASIQKQRDELQELKELREELTPLLEYYEERIQDFRAPIEALLVLDSKEWPKLDLHCGSRVLERLLSSLKETYDNASSERCDRICELTIDRLRLHTIAPYFSWLCTSAYERRLCCLRVEAEADLETLKASNADEVWEPLARLLAARDFLPSSLRSEIRDQLDSLPFSTPGERGSVIALWEGRSRWNKRATARTVLEWSKEQLHSILAVEKDLMSELQPGT